MNINQDKYILLRGSYCGNKYHKSLVGTGDIHFKFYELCKKIYSHINQTDLIDMINSAKKKMTKMTINFVYEDKQMIVNFTPNYKRGINWVCYEEINDCFYFKINSISYTDSNVKINLETGFGITLLDHIWINASGISQVYWLENNLLTFTKMFSDGGKYYATRPNNNSILFDCVSNNYSNSRKEWIKEKYNPKAICQKIDLLLDLADKCLNPTKQIEINTPGNVCVLESTEKN